MRKLFFIFFMGLLSCMFGIQIGGVVEIQYDQDAASFTAEDSLMTISSPLDDDAFAEMTLKNTSGSGAILLDNYILAKSVNSDITVYGGLLGIPFGQYYTRLVSDSLLKATFDLTSPGFGADWVIGTNTLSAVLFNNTSTSRADAYCLRLTVPLSDSLILGMDYLKDGALNPASNIFAEAAFESCVIEGEYTVRNNDTWLSFGGAYRLITHLDGVIRYDVSDISNSKTTVTAAGLNYYMDDLTFIAEYQISDSGGSTNRKVLGKASLGF